MSVLPVTVSDVATRSDVARVAGTKRVRNGGVSLVAGARRGGGRRRDELLALILGDELPVRRPGPAGEDEAMGLPPFGRAVALIANAIASTDWYARRRTDEPGVWERLVEQPSILTDPYPLSTCWHWKWGVAEDAILYGNTFGLWGDLDWRTGRAGWVVPLPADQVWIMTDSTRPGWYEWVIGGQTFDPSEIFHVPFGNRSGELLGRGVIQQYGWWLGGADATEQYSRDVFGAGGLPPAILSSTSVATQTQADELKTKWRELTSTREPVVMPGGTTLVPIVGNAEQAQLVEARTWNAQMCADVVGVPGWKLGLAGPTMTYQNIETADIDFVRDSVDRYARPLSSALTKWALPGGTEVAWDYASRMRADQKTTAEVLTMYVGSKVLLPDEARQTLGRGPLPTTSPAPAGPQDEPDGGTATGETTVPTVGAGVST